MNKDIVRVNFCLYYFQKTINLICSLFLADGDLPAALTLAGDHAPPVTLAGRLVFSAGVPGMMALGLAGAGARLGAGDLAPPALVLGLRGLALVALDMLSFGTVGVDRLPEALPPTAILGEGEGEEPGQTLRTLGVLGPGVEVLFRFTGACHKKCKK